MSKQNPYLNARREWDERYGGLISRARNWQLMAAGSLAVAVVAVVGIAFVGSQSKINRLWWSPTNSARLLLLPVPHQWPGLIWTKG